MEALLSQTAEGKARIDEGYARIAEAAMRDHERQQRRAQKAESAPPAGAPAQASASTDPSPAPTQGAQPAEDPGGLTASAPSAVNPGSATASPAGRLSLPTLRAEHKQRSDSGMSEAAPPRNLEILLHMLSRQRRQQDLHPMQPNIEGRSARAMGMTAGVMSLRGKKTKTLQVP